MRSAGRIRLLALACALPLFLCSCGPSFEPLGSEAPAAELTREDLLSMRLEPYDYYDVNRHQLRWLMSEDEVKSLFEGAALSSEGELPDRLDNPEKSVSYRLDPLTYFPEELLQGVDLSYGVSLCFVEIEGVYRLTQATYSYSSVSDTSEAESVGRRIYAFIQGDLAGQYGEAGYHLATDFSDIEPHYLYRHACFYETDRWHVGHNVVDLDLKVTVYEAEERTWDSVPRRESFSIYEMNAPFYPKTDLTYDKVSKDSLVWSQLPPPPEDP